MSHGAWKPVTRSRIRDNEQESENDLTMIWADTPASPGNANAMFPCAYLPVSRVWYVLYGCVYGLVGLSLAQHAFPILLGDDARFESCRTDTVGWSRRDGELLLACWPQPWKLIKYLDKQASTAQSFASRSEPLISGPRLEKSFLHHRNPLASCR
jgi:hypothetical protein